MAIGFDTSWVADPPDVRGAGFDEWAAMTGVPSTSPIVGGAGFGAGDARALHISSGSFTDVVTGSEGTPAMPGGAPAHGPARSHWNGWRELFNPQSPMLWLLVFALVATSLIHFRVQAGVGH